MAKHRSIGEYKPEAEDWTAYTKRVGQYFTANDITDDGEKMSYFPQCVWSVNLWTHSQFSCP